MKATTKLRNLLKEPDMLVVPGCYDAVSALISQHQGFKAVYMGGYSAEGVTLGHPVMGLRTLTETMATSEAANLLPWARALNRSRGDTPLRGRHWWQSTGGPRLRSGP